jgi:hypothetical protein
MRTVALDIQQYFKPIAGQRPWRARLRMGSFLTLDFGRKVKEDRHFRGEWHLWVYQANWSLLHGDRKLADSSSGWQVMDVAIRRLEEVDFTGVEFDPQNSTTAFLFDDFRLIVTPADYLDSPDERDEYWLFYMPDNLVLTVGPNGVEVGRSDSLGANQELPVARPVKRAIDFNL